MSGSRTSKERERLGAFINHASGVEAEVAAADGRRLKRTACIFSLFLLLILTAGARLQEQPADGPSWAFPHVVEGRVPEEPGPQRLAGSSRSYTYDEIYDLHNPPDWFPEEHPPAPEVIVSGEGEVLACGSCHLMSGLGRPEMADLAGLPVEYFVQQMADFASGARVDWTGRMNAIAPGLSAEETRQAAEWFASLTPRATTRVRETDVVPETFIGPRGFMRFVRTNGGVEPTGNRIITVPEDQEGAMLRDPYMRFIAYVPVGSVARGKDLVQTGGGGRTIPCAICHGTELQGTGNVPRLAGVHPIYTARQLYLFRDGRRNGVDAALMEDAVERLTDADIVAIAAYLGSLAP